MPQDRYFSYKKSQIESFVKTEFKKKFRSAAKISIRKRQKFIDEMTRKVSKRFGKDILFLIDFSKQGFCAVISPVHTESTDKGKLSQSFSHPQVFYTTHCIDRFSERMNTDENVIIQLDAYFNEAILSFGENPGFLTCSDGVFACELENERFIIKTFLNFDLLSDDQIKQFYGSDMISMLPQEYTAENISGADFIIEDEQALPQSKPQELS
ncbi:MAG: hypothetical protein HOK41_00935 [Nitrospina sp.]|jgi:hypothetical protein|nr:hypothetical protein [Nitrospina sp.]